MSFIIILKCFFQEFYILFILKSF